VSVCWSESGWRHQQVVVKSKLWQRREFGQVQESRGSHFDSCFDLHVCVWDPSGIVTKDPEIQDENESRR
jgi:hypothetical protein